MPNTSELASDLTSVAKQVEEHGTQIGELTAKVEEIATAGSAVVSSSSSGSERVQGGETLLQEIVDFLHWAFPPAAVGDAGRRPPGKSSVELESDKAAEDQKAQADRDRASQADANRDQNARNSGIAAADPNDPGKPAGPGA